MRLIDIDALKTALFKIHVHDGMDSEMLLYFDDAEKVIDTMPTIDAVQVVRCRECKHWGYVDGSNLMTCQNGILTMFEPYGFCSHGERRKGNATGND